jgi:histidinol phosphatase-like enzyme
MNFYFLDLTIIQSMKGVMSAIQFRWDAGSSRASAASDQLEVSTVHLSRSSSPI